MKNPDKKLLNCQCKLWNIRDELLSYATLFKSFKNIEEPEQDFYGVGLALARISKKIDKINDTIDQVSMQIP